MLLPYGIGTAGELHPGTAFNRLFFFFLFLFLFFGNPQMHRCGRIDYESDYESAEKPEETQKFKEKETHMKKIGVS